MEIKIGLDKNDERKFKKATTQVPEKVFSRHVGKAAGKAMTPVSRDAKKLAPKDTGDYRKSIGKKKKSYPRKKVVWVGVGPRKGKPNATLSHLLELGHRIIQGAVVRKGSPTKREDIAGGVTIGFAPAIPHLRPAMRKNKTKVISIYKTELRRGILEEARKA